MGRSAAIAVEPIEAPLLNFGLSIFQATLAGKLPSNYVWTEGSTAVHAGIEAVIAVVGAHGLSHRDLRALIIRMLAFSGLLETMANDDRLSFHVTHEDGHFEVSDAFIRLAARAPLVMSADGMLGFDRNTFVSRLVN